MGGARASAPVKPAAAPAVIARGATGSVQRPNPRKPDGRTNTERLIMAEPTSSTGAAGFAAFKMMGGAAGMAAGGAGLAAIIVMLMTPPRSPREWAVGLISTVVGSVCGGAALITYFNLHYWMQTPVGLVAMLGLVFASGLPAWAVVRAAFTWLEKRRGQDLAEMVGDAKEAFARAINK